jgi:hypothetical protein
MWWIWKRCKKIIKMFEILGFFGTAKNWDMFLMKQELDCAKFWVACRMERCVRVVPKMSRKNIFRKKYTWKIKQKTSTPEPVLIYLNFLDVFQATFAPDWRCFVNDGIWCSTWRFKHNNLKVVAIIRCFHTKFSLTNESRDSNIGF